MDRKVAAQADRERRQKEAQARKMVLPTSARETMLASFTRQHMNTQLHELCSTRRACAHAVPCV